MIALVTGASSGIGKDMSYYLNQLGYDVILVARDETKLRKVKEELEKRKCGKVGFYVVDLSRQEECKLLYQKVKEEWGTIDILINNAGFGLFGEFTQTSLETEIDMIQTNVMAVHILTKLFLQDMVEKDKGAILNVASIAGFMPGPLMATYYATKNYVLRLSQAIHKELTKKHSHVHISVLCPGPVNTNFNQVAQVTFHLREASSQKVAKYAIDKLVKRKFSIIPGVDIKLARIGSKIAPDNLLAEICYHAQKKKEKK